MAMATTIYVIYWDYLVKLASGCGCPSMPEAQLKKILLPNLDKVSK